MTSRLTLPDRLGNAGAADLHKTLLAHRGTALLLDAGKLQQLGGLSVQVLLSAVKTWQSDGKPFRVAGFRPDLIHRLALLGLTPAQFDSEGA